MSLKSASAIFSTAALLAIGCLDRKHVEDASAPVEAGVGTDTVANPSLDGPSGPSDGGGTKPIDVSPGNLDGNAAAEAGGDFRVSLDVALDAALPDVPQGPDAPPDVSTDAIVQPPPDLGPDYPIGPEVALDLGRDTRVLPDVPPDIPFGPEVQPDLPPTGCVIGGTTYANGASQSGNTCQYCDPTSSATSWSTRTDGTTCNGATSGQYCSSGSCKPGCFISGIYYATSAANDANPCLVCQPSSSATSWTQLASGATCKTGQICNGGSCQAGCWISGAFVGSGATNTTNTCQICTPSKTTTDWSNNDAATAVACGTCGGTAACVNKTLGPCSKTAQNYWQDSDGDGYGNPFLSPTQNCNPTPGWVTRAGDCNDSDAAVHPGTTRCETFDANALTTCGSDGNFVTTSCPNGCAGGQCKSFSTVGTAGTVTCGTLQCSTSQGCSFIAPLTSAPTCGTTAANWYSMCDGPTDCSGGQVCCEIVPAGGGGESTQCVAGSCPYSNPGGSGYLVCDPSASTCTGGTTCQIQSSYLSIYVCK